MNVRAFVKVFGTLLKFLGLLMLIPAVVSLLYSEYSGVAAFLLPAFLALILGLLLERAGIETVLGNKEGVALVAFGWLGAAIIGSLPYWILGLNPVDALFESMSGFTTTGATILAESNADGYWIINATAASHSLGSMLIDMLNFQTANATLNLANLSDVAVVRATDFNSTFNSSMIDVSLNNPVEKSYFGLLFWRSFTQWLGGMGIILLFIAILPKLGVAGRQLFKAEVPGPTEDLIKPRIRETAKILWGVYIVLTAVEFMLLMLADMPAYDAICNTFSTMACGGFSPQAMSIAAYNEPLIEIIIIVFMFLAGANFALHYRTMYVNRMSLLKDPEFKFYSLLVVIAVLVILLFGGTLADNHSDSLRIAAFQVVSIVTTTGFATANYDLWSGSAKLVLFLLMFTGACAGSTSGGIKMVRILLMIRYSRRELFRAIHPKAVMPIRLKGQLVKEDVIHSILAFFALYIMIFAIASVIFASVCTMYEDDQTSNIATYFVSEDVTGGNEIICMTGDNWSEIDNISSFTSKGDKAKLICLYSDETNLTKKKDWIKVDDIIYSSSNEYQKTGQIALFRGDERQYTDKMISAASAVAVNLGNVGPGFGDFGPEENFSKVPPLGKLVLIICMWIGRLEILTVLLLLLPDFWKN